ncbi:hypothetical protein E3Q23_02129 [Wallemia mellicola]|uniref:Uncharacterized protein n=1 Tax=Wallemia mellicola TaxID=1708541 RepID=A0A4T0LZW1_9BASI|nr:hypothetical protein E3Q23_02129 [Wallemia mellicola]TIC66377.1 hypothetical protein E3Q01_01751 [Wallemia mellicola]
MIILKGDQADFTDRNSRGELVHDEPYLPRYSQQGYDFNYDADRDHEPSMTETGDSNLRPLLPIHAPYHNTRDRTTAAPYNPLETTSTNSSRHQQSSENPFAHPDDSQSLLIGPVPDNLAKRRTKKRFFIALAWALSVYVAIGAILGPVLEHYLNDNSPNVSDESDSNYQLPYGLSANRSSVSSKLALQGSSELVLLPASGKIDIQLPSTVNGKVKVERSPTNETDKDGNPTAPSKETSFWAQFTLPKSVDAVMSKHSESLIAHLLVPLQPLQLVLPLQQPPLDSNGTNSTDTSHHGKHHDDDDDDNDDKDDSGNSTSKSNQRRRSFEAQPLDSRETTKPIQSTPPSKWHRALCPLISPFGNKLPSFLPIACNGIHSMRAQLWSSYNNEWSKRNVQQEPTDLVDTLPNKLSKRALASDQLNATTSNSTSSGDFGQIQFSPGENQPSEWASLIVESLNQNVTGGLNITVDDPYSNGTSAVDIIPACTNCLADAAITLYLPSDLPALDLSISTKSKDMGVFISDLSEVMLDTVRLDLQSGNIAVEELNATTQTINTYNGTILGKFSTNSYLSMGSTTSTNATVSLFDKINYYGGDAYINAYASKGNSTLSINGTALRDDVYVNADGRKSSQLNLPLDYTGKFGVKAKHNDGTAILNVENSTKVVRHGIGEIKNTDQENPDPNDDHIDWIWSTNISQ